VLPCGEPFLSIATLCYRPSRADENDEPETEEGDKEYADEIIQRARTDP
jgi:hypothetical protein